MFSFQNLLRLVQSLTLLSLCALGMAPGALAQMGPPPEEVCKNGQFHKELYVAWALDSRKIPRKLIVQNGRQDKDALLMDAKTFCVKDCSRDDKRLLDPVHDNAEKYFGRLFPEPVYKDYDLPSDGPAVFTVHPVNPKEGDNPIRKILEDNSPWTVTCAPITPTFSENFEKQISRVTTPILLRASPKDLWVRKSGASDQATQQFTALKSATVGLTVDDIAHQESFNIDGVLGLQLDQLDQFNFAKFDGQGGKYLANGFVPYIGYDRQYVKTSTPKTKINDLNNLTFGGIFRHGWGAEGYFIDIWANPAFIYSAKSGAKVGNLEFGIRPGVRLNQLGECRDLFANYTDCGFSWSPVYLKIYAEGHGLLGNVIDAGNDSGVAQTGNFERLGPEEGVTFIGKEGLFQNLGITLLRRDLYALKGQFEHLSRTEVSFNYGLPTLKNLTLSLNYFNGRDENTYEDQDQVNLALGLKF